MIFKERQKRAMDTMNHRNREYLNRMNGQQGEDGEPSLPTTDPKDENPLAKENLENGDLSAMVISALLTFLPIMLILAAIMFLAVKLLS